MLEQSGRNTITNDKSLFVQKSKLILLKLPEFSNQKVGTATSIKHPTKTEQTKQILIIVISGLRKNRLFEKIG